MTFAEHRKHWSNPYYQELVKQLAHDIKSDGCSCVIDFFLPGCWEHDIAYKTHRDPLGRTITKREADRRLMWYIEENSWFGRWSPMAHWRYWGVRKFGRKAWEHIT